jgi:hypothetical protein
VWLARLIVKPIAHHELITVKWSRRRIRCCEQTVKDSAVIRGISLDCAVFPNITYNFRRNQNPRLHRHAFPAECDDSAED